MNVYCLRFSISLPVYYGKPNVYTDVCVLVEGKKFYVPKAVSECQMREKRIEIRIKNKKHLVCSETTRTLCNTNPLCSRRQWNGARVLYISLSDVYGHMSSIRNFARYVLLWRID